MSTPKSNGTVRSTVHTSGGISKSLLTPCRRIGLSKNKKKQNNDFISPLGGKNCELRDIALPDDNEVVYQCNKKHEITNNSISSNTTITDPVTVNILTGSTLAKTKTQSNDVDNSSKNYKENVPLKEVKIKRRLNVDLKNNYCELQSNEQTENSSSQNHSDITCANLSNTTEIKTADIDDFTSTMIKCQTKRTHSKTSTKKDNTWSSSNATENYITSSNTKDLINRKNMGKVYTNSFDDFEQVKSNSVLKMNETNVGVSMLVENKQDIIYKNDIKSHETRTVDQKRASTRSVKRKLSMKKTTSNLSDSDEEIFTKNPTKTNESAEKEESKLIEEIIQLEKTVQNKEMVLQKLQQVQIYRSLHKLEDLNKDTNVWKISCQEALRELLMKLKEHATIDMSVLLQNLKAPLHLFKYDAENDYFL